MHAHLRPDTASPPSCATRLAPKDEKSIVNFDSCRLLQMTDEIAIDLTIDNGCVMQRSVPISETNLWVRFFSFDFVAASRIACSPQLNGQLNGRQFVAVSDNIAQLTRVAELWVRSLRRLYRS